MMNFWINLLVLMLNWSLLTFVQGVDVALVLLSVLFFAAYFVLPIINERGVRVIGYLLPLISVSAFSPSVASPFLWLILIVLSLEVSLISSRTAFLRYAVYTGALLSVVLAIQDQWYPLISAVFLFSFVTYIFTVLKESREKEKGVKKNYKKLSDDYAKMKRQMATQEQVARQEERSHIARDIHDSVGHRLTALLMQLEVARHTAKDTETKQYFSELKALAQDSLHDTRTAVKALRSDETAGIQAIVQLIRKLESESHLEIRFVIQSGVLGVKLSNAQSVTVYRSIQEALTNMMRHSKTRKATIEFSLLGDRYLQFKVCHAIHQKVTIKEGFGLTSMRNRLEELDGGLTLTQQPNELRVIGQFPLQKQV